jgi:hypothetical protein
VRRDIPSRSIDGLAERLSRALADRYSRRSFLGGVGRTSAVLALGGGATLAWPGVANAHNNPCREDLSVTCYRLTGTNDCPSDTCGCGYWELCGVSPCSSGQAKRWTDCCAEEHYGCENRRGCVDHAPTCFNHKDYKQGCRNEIGAIRCRMWRCVNTSRC